MNNNRSLITSLVLVMGFLFLWNAFVVSKYAPPKKAHQPITQNQTNASLQASSSNGSVSALPSGEPTTTVVQADGVEVTVESMGGKVSSWKINELNHWLELVPHPKVDATFPLETFPDLQFHVLSNNNGTVVMAADHPDGYRITKTLSLLNEAPFHKFTLSFQNLKSTPLSIKSHIGWSRGVDKHVVGSAPNPKAEAAVFSEMRSVAFSDTVKSWKPGVIFGRDINVDFTGPFQWAGVDNNHFLAAFISKDKSISSIHTDGNRKNHMNIQIPIDVSLQPNEVKDVSYLLYVGPKKYSDLKKMNLYNLSASVDFGFFGVIAKVLLECLQYFHKVTGNYGWAIVILTVFLQILVFPLTRKSLIHSSRMKELQPQLKALQEQFKTDPKRLQIETFNLYKKNGMNLMGMEGCIPTLLQIPLFFAFYSTLRVAYELRGAPWIFWIHDLGVRDPHYVLPVLMGVGMFIQQKLTVVAADPSQAKMMMFMPVMFTFMFLQLPAGLVLYWSVNSIMTILIQRTIHWHLGKSKMAPTIIDVKN